MIDLLQESPQEAQPTETSRTLVYADAIREALELSMAMDPRVYVMGLGVTDPKGIFGTTTGLEQRFGSRRVFDMPVAENGMTGVAIGSALVGMRPVMVHQRVDFALLAFDQIMNTAAKWHFMFAGKRSVPLVIRLLIGRGWGQGPQHAQSLQAIFGHFPGLHVMMPVTPYDAKGLLISAIEHDHPVISLEHRWLYQTYGQVPSGHYRVPLGTAQVLRAGDDVSVVATSIGVIDALQAAEALAHQGLSVEVIDLRSIRPLDRTAIAASLEKTGRLLVVDHGWKTFGVAGEILASMTESHFDALRVAPRRVTTPDAYVATAPSLTKDYYPTSLSIVNEVLAMYGRPSINAQQAGIELPTHHDVPNAAFRGPF